MCDQEQTLAFIADYRKHPLLWDCKRNDYTNRIKRKHAINELAAKYSMTPTEIKNKIKSLRSYFSKELMRVAKRRDSGADGTYESTWFAYGPLMFLLDSTAPKEKRDSYSERTTITSGRHEDYWADERTGTGNSEENYCESMNIKVEEDLEENLMDHEFTQPLIRTKRNMKRTRDDNEEKTEHTLNLAAREFPRKDDCSIFGEMVASQLRKLSKRNQAIAKREMSNLLFDLEMQEIDSPMYPAVSTLSSHTPCSSPNSVQ